MIYFTRLVRPASQECISKTVFNHGYLRYIKEELRLVVLQFEVVQCTEMPQIRYLHIVVLARHG